MWVYSPKIKMGEGENEKVFPLVKLGWDRKEYPIKEGINEIPEPVAQAYFLFALPENVEAIEKNWESQKRVALQRWGIALKTSPPPAEFLAQFTLAETREGLETILKEEREEKSGKA